MKLPIAFFLSLISLSARGDAVLRMAGIAPEGTSFTLDLKAFSREVESRTHGHVRLKWYWGGIVGDEVQAFERIRRDQLDGQAAAQACDQVAPSIRVSRVLGLIQSYEEEVFVMRRLGPQLESEMKQHGFVGFVAGMGSDIVYSRNPIHSLAELKKERIWLWNIDELMRVQLEAIGVHPVALPLQEALPAYEKGAIDGFFAIPAAALAFQWSARARYLSELKIGFVTGCLVVTNRAFDALSLDEQRIFREAAAKLILRFDDLGRTNDERLLHGLFQRQGLRAIPVSPMYRSEFFSVAEEARQHLPPALVPLAQKVSAWLADYRANQRSK
jgi:TRAP-type C4-dicarboxylate transport system substrate-binding protein